MCRPNAYGNFFTKEAGGYRVNKNVRERVLFATHNLIKDPPFSKLDLVTCRNLLIYLNRDVQEQVFPLFHFALRPGGFLFLGSSESIDGASDLFAPINAKHRVFRANPVNRSAYAVPTLPLEAPIVQPRQRSDATAERRRIAFGELHQRMLEHYAPPSIMVNNNNEIVHLSEHAGRFIQLGGGEPSLNLLQVVLPPLRLEMRTALFQAFQSGKTTEARRVHLQRDGRSVYVNMIVRPDRDPATNAEFALVLFAEADEILGTQGKTGDDGAAEPVVRHLEEENERLKAQLETTIEQYETGVEELRASNEELQAINEELRSTTEELETSKEELQSVNEELRTVNDELKHRVEEVSATNDDLLNLMSSTDIATVFLDRSLRVKRYTPRALDLFNLIPLDEGRSLADITHKLRYDTMLADAGAVLRTLQPIEREVESRAGRFLIARMVPYRTMEDRIDGLVLTFVDISARKQAEHALRESLESTTEVLESISDAFYAVDADFRFVYINKKTEEWWGRTRETLLGKDYRTEFPAANGSELYQLHLEAMAERRVIHYETLSPLLQRWISVSLYPNARGGLSCYFQDITERKRREAHRAFLADIADGLSRLSTAEEIVQTVGVKIGAYMSLVTCNFIDVDETKNTLTVSHSWNRSDVPSVVRTYAIEEYASGWSEKSRAGEVVVVSDTQTDSRTDARRYAEYQVGAFVAVPFNRADEWKFLFSVTDTAPRDWQPDEIELFRELCNRIFPRLERARAEAALRESEACFRLMVDAVPQSIWITDAEGRVEFLNQQWINYSGAQDQPTTAAEIAAGFIHPDDVPRLMAAFTDALRTGSSFEIEQRNRSATGEYRWFLNRANPYRDPQTGKIIKWFGVGIDIHDRKQTEAALRESEERFRATFEQAQIGIVQASLDGYVLVPNPGFCDIIGYTPDEARGLHVRDITHPDDYEADMAQGERVLRGEIGGYTIEKRYVRKDGVVLWVNLTSTVVRDAAGAPIYVLAIVENIDERKRAEAALRESEELLRGLIANLPGGAAFVVDRDLRYVVAEGEALSDVGVTPDEYTAKTIFEALGDELASSYEPLYRQALNGEPFVHEHEVGSRSYVSRGVPLRGATSDIYAVLAVSYDITERKRAEQAVRRSEARLQAIANLVPDLLWSNDAAGMMDWYNQRWLDYTGQTLAQAQGYGWLNVIHPDDREQSRQHFQTAVATGEPLRQEHRMRSAHGDYRWFLIQSQPLRDDAGQIVRWYGAATDIHEERMALQAEQAARAEAEAALHTRDQFLSIASHELRTPLTSLVGYTGMLPRAGAQGTEKMQQMTDRILRQAQRLNGLIDQLLDVSRLQRGQFAIERRPVDLAVLVTHVVDETRATLPPNTHHTIELIRPHASVVVDGDAQRLEQVIQNLLSNAIKYSPQGGPVRVQIRRTPIEAVVNVTDQGIGIPADAQARLFEPFYCAPNVGGQASGFGLGLHIVREIVERHNGRIEVESAEGTGSTFRVVLPLQRGEHAGEHGSAAPSAGVIS